MPPVSVPRFQPYPGLRNPHLQTILGVYFKGTGFPHHAIRRRVRLPDGDQIVLHDTQPRTWLPHHPLALLLHGLAGCHRSGVIVRLARLLARRGIRTVRMDLRGAGSGFALARGCYNAGCSEDVRHALAALQRLAPDAPQWLIGISLGGNIALKLAAEAADRPVPALTRVAAIAPPIDLEACMALLARPHNRIYEQHFVRELIRQARRRASLYPLDPLPEFPARMSLRLFDELYTAPRCGFRNAAEYYAHSAAGPRIPRIRLDTWILAARDDPFVDARPIAALPPLPSVQVRLTDHGGHVGFLGPDGSGGSWWGEQAVVAWLCDRPESGPRAGPVVGE